MEFLKRKHFSLWITTTTTFIIMASIALNVSTVQGLQGVPTWIMHGMQAGRQSDYIAKHTGRQACSQSNMQEGI
ncbi:hypothetical protein FF38_07695 [Lucilia cuprina]|uniref:Uncharacterized protein n=1 Tax=Lucilia cuprina TaxID=7375 RepID=A0A0L0CJZ7_LUCCU|nr:hypothetical protein FF38_07695 [Lucilia cuprina]